MFKEDDRSHVRQKDPIKGVAVAAHVLHINAFAGPSIDVPDLLSTHSVSYTAFLTDDERFSGVKSNKTDSAAGFYPPLFERSEVEIPGQYHRPAYEQEITDN